MKWECKNCNYQTPVKTWELEELSDDITNGIKPIFCPKCGEESLYLVKT